MQEVNWNDVEETIKNALSKNPNITIIVRSTVPVGFTERVKKHFNFEDIFFSPEFLREGKALIDNLYPSRIIIGSKSKRAIKFLDYIS